MCSQIIIYILAVCLVIGAVDYLADNRFGFGHCFQRGLETFCPIFIMMGGILALMPAVEQFLAPIAMPFCRLFRIDPGLLPGFLLPNDTGGFFLSKAMADNPHATVFGGMLLASVMGTNVSFNLPMALAMIPKDDRPEMARGFIIGFITLPVGCFAGGLTAGIPFGFLLKQIVFVTVFSAIIALALRYIPGILIRAIVVFGKGVNVVAALGIAAVMVITLCNLSSPAWLDRAEHIIQLLLPIIIALPGAYVMVELLSRLGRRLFRPLGNRLGINESSILGLISSITNTILTFALVKDMDRRGKFINFAFLTASSFALADHLAFCSAVAPDLLFPMLVTKFTGALTALLLALVLSRHSASSTMKHPNFH